MTREEVGQALDEELERQASGIRTEYVHRQRDLEELRNPEQGMDKKVNLTGIRRAIEASEGHTADSEQYAYRKADRVRTSSDRKTRTTSLHGSLGSKLAGKGEYVFEVSIAGSGFNEFRKMHHHAPGKSSFIGNAVQNDKNTILDPGEVGEGYPAGADKAKIRALMDKLYGKRIVRNGQEEKFIRKKVVDGKVRYSLPGPGSFDSSDKTRSMDALRHNTLEFAQEYLTERFQAFKSGAEKPKPINLLLKGHSRGGVAIGEAMQMIQAWVQKEHPEYEELVKYDLIQLDPVPGTGNMREHKELNLTEDSVTDKLGTAERANTKFRQNVRSTVFYSINTNEDVKHNLFFSPQTVIGANRVILCPTSHTLHLASVDNTQEGNLSKVGFTFAGNGELYRGSGINDLEDGVYVMDESATLVKIKSPKQLESIMSTALGKPSRAQSKRRQTMQTATEKWFEAHPTPMEKRMAIINRDMGSCMDRIVALKEGSALRKAGESALEGRMNLASLATKGKLTDADRVAAGECISKMILFEIASRSPNPDKISANFEKLTKALEKSDEIKAFIKGCTSEDLVGFFDRAGEKAFCKNLQIQNNKLKKQKEASPEKVKKAEKTAEAPAPLTNNSSVARI